MKFSYVSKLFLAGVPLLVFVGCGGETGNDSDGESGDGTEKSTNYVSESNISTGSVSDPNFVYYDLDASEEIVLTEEEAQSNSDWDVAFRRSQIYLNRFSDPQVSLYFTGNTNEFYDSEGDPILERFINATPSTEEAGFINAEITIPDEADFNGDVGESAIDGWYTYNFIAHTVTPDDERFYIVGSDEALTKFRVTELVQDGFGMSSITLSAAYQASGEEVFSEEQILTIESIECGDAAYIDFENLEVVTEAGAWDVMLPCSDGLLSFDIDLADDALALNDPLYTEIDGIGAADKPYYPWVSNIDVTFAFTEYGDDRSGYGWGDYGVNGGHLLWPNYAIYVIKTDQAYYKFQITSYYDTETSASGSYSFRYDLLETVEEESP